MDVNTLGKINVKVFTLTCFKFCDNPKMNASEQFERIEAKVRQLLTLVKQLRRESAGLQEENRELKTHIAQRDAAIRALQVQVERANQDLAKLRHEETEQSEKFKEQVDQYVKEIDKRIELLANN